MMPNRRSALCTLSATAVAALLAPNQAHAASDPAKCSLGFGTYGLPKHSLEAAITAVASVGYNSIEICILPDRDSSPENLTADRRKKVSGFLKDKSLRLTSLLANLRPIGTEGQHKKDVERLKRACELAHDLAPDAPPTVQTVLGGKNWGEVDQLCVERLADWVKVADETETNIAFKPHRGHAMTKPSEAAWVLAELGKPKRLSMWFDYSHFAFRDLPMDQMVQQSLSITGGIAVKDAVETDSGVRFDLPGGAKTIDYAKLFRLFYQGGYRGDICVEVSSQIWRKPGYDPIAALNSSFQHLSVAMREASVPRG